MVSAFGHSSLTSCVLMVTKHGSGSVGDGETDKTANVTQLPVGNKRTVGLRVLSSQSCGTKSCWISYRRFSPANCQLTFVLGIWDLILVSRDLHGCHLGSMCGGLWPTLNFCGNKSHQPIKSNRLSMTNRKYDEVSLNTWKGETVGVVRGNTCRVCVPDRKRHKELKLTIISFP